MMNVIKTAIITIIISIISGLLVEYFKNLAPRILCNIGNGIPVKMGDKKVYAYVITVSNLSKKIIHELSLNVQSSKSNLEIADAKITKGLKFESSLKDNILDIDIPFLSKGDEFSIKLYVESRKKPVIVMRSPENFKQVDSIEQNGLLSSLFSKANNTNEDAGRSVKKNERIVPNEKDDYTMIMNKPLRAEKNINKGILNFDKNKKILIATASVILLILAGILVKFYFTGAPTKAQTQAVKTDASKQSTDTSSESTNNGNKNVGRNTGTKTPENKTTRNTNANTSTGGSTSDTSSKASSSETNENKDTKPSTSGATGNSDTTKSTGGSNENTNTNTNTSTNQTNENAGTNTSTNGGNADTTNTSTSGTNQSAGK